MEKKQNKISLSLALTFVFIAVLLTFIATFSMSYLLYSPGDNYSGPGAAELQQIHHYYSKHYDGEFDRELITRSVIAGYLSGTGDKYGNFLTQNEFLSYFGSEDGSRVGIGIQIVPDTVVNYKASDNKTYTGGYYIASIIQDSGAERAGLRPGDILIEVEGVILGKDGFDKAYLALSGEYGDRKEITVLRGVEYKLCETCGSVVVDSTKAVPLTFTVTISTLPEEEVVSSRMYNSNTGIIKITSFLTGSSEDFETALRDLIDKGAKNIVFDLRDNPGGIVDEVVDMLDILIPKGKIIVSTIDKNGKKTEYFSKKDDDIDFTGFKFAVLVNGNSASAAELFTAALRDYDLATVVGTTTYGKGVGQNTFGLLTGGYVTVTTFKYNPPSGVNFDGEGVHPTLGYEIELNPGIDLGNVEDRDDNQLQKALDSFR